MSLTIEELRTLIQSAKQQLAASAEVWLNVQTETNYTIWLEALRAPDSHSMQRLIQINTLPLIREDLINPDNNVELALDVGQFLVNPLQELLRQDLTPNNNSEELQNNSQQQFSQALVNAVIQYSEQPQLTERRTYRPVSHMQQNLVLIQMGRITTLMEQLHQMESCLEVIQPQVNLTALQLTQAMAISISVNEWRFVEPGVETVNAYEQRLQLVRDQLDKVQRINLPNLTLFAKQISIKASQFEETLRLFTQSLNDAFSSEQDNRSWIIRTLTAYRPWHKMIHQLAVTLFGRNQVIHSNEGTLEVQQAVLTDLNVQLQQSLREPLISLSTEYAALTQSTIKELSDIQDKVSTMKANLNLVAKLGLMRLFALRTPTAVLGPFGFFQRVHALSQVPPQARSLVWDEQQQEEPSSSMGFSQGGRAE